MISVRFAWVCAIAVLIAAEYFSPRLNPTRIQPADLIETWDGEFVKPENIADDDGSFSYFRWKKPDGSIYALDHPAFLIGERKESLLRATAAALAAVVIILAYRARLAERGWHRSEIRKTVALWFCIGTAFAAGCYFIPASSLVLRLLAASHSSQYYE